MRRVVAEFAGTFALVLVGCGAIVACADLSGAPAGLVVALAFGLVVTAVILALGPVSGAHINPAVTVALWAAGRFPGRRVLLYVSAQAAGAVAASLVLAALAGRSGGLGATLPAVEWGPAFVLEAAMTWALVLVVLWCPAGHRVALGAGLVVGLCAFAVGPLTGASLNPARSLGPALVAGNPQALWLYLTAPVAGALLAVPACRRVRGRACCGCERAAA